MIKTIGLTIIGIFLLGLLGWVLYITFYKSASPIGTIQPVAPVSSTPCNIDKCNAWIHTNLDGISQIDTSIIPDCLNCKPSSTYFFDPSSNNGTFYTGVSGASASNATKCNNPNFPQLVNPSAPDCYTLMAIPGGSGTSFPSCNTTACNTWIKNNMSLTSNFSTSQVPDCANCAPVLYSTSPNGAGNDFVVSKGMSSSACNNSAYPSYNKSGQPDCYDSVSF
jgi:hypothetical protein